MDPTATEQTDPDLAELEQMIAADEAADPYKPRNARGQFVSTEEAARAGNELQEEILEAAEGASASETPPEQESNSGTRPAETAADPARPPAQAEGEQAGQAQQSGQAPTRYQKARERAARAWKEINEGKAQLELERTKLEAERAELTRVRAESAQARNARAEAQRARTAQDTELFKYTAEQYEDAAIEFEANGEKEMAERAWSAAEKVRAGKDAQQATQQNANGQPTAAAAAPSQPDQFQAQQRESWQKARTDFPDIMAKDSPANKALREFIGAHPRVLDYPHGPYLAAELVMAKQKASRLPQVEQEAARVPELQKQVETLTAKVKELQALTSLPSSHSPVSSGSAKGETPWADKSLSEMERDLDRDLVNA